jgi:hypothetical protein
MRISRISGMKVREHLGAGRKPAIQRPANGGESFIIPLDFRVRL